MRALAVAVQDGIPLELMSLLTPYGRDRRVALRIERMPNRARLTRGRNNGDGSWSVTRDEVEGLEYLPPKGATESPPTLVVRVIGLDNDNGATLTVLDYPLLANGADGESPLDGIEEHTSRREELRNLRSEVTKTKTALRVAQSELDAARKSFELELEERLNEAAADAASALEERRAAWQAETRDRISKAESRAQERLEQARKLWKRDVDAQVAQAEEEWKSAEADRSAAAEARWQEQSARLMAKETAQLKKIEAELSDARSRMAANASADAELRRLHEELGMLRAALAEGDARIIETRATATEQAREQSRRDLSTALSQAEEKWKAAEVRRLAVAEAEWKEFADRTVAELARRLEDAETELAQARSETRAAREPRDSGETKQLRAELAAARQTIAARENEIAEALAARTEANRRAEELAVTVGRAEAAWRKDETKRLAEAEARWSEQSAQVIADISGRLQRSEAALAKAEAQSGRVQRDDGEIRRLNGALVDAQAKLSRLQEELAHAQVTADEAEARSSEQSAQVIADISGKLQRSEAAFAKAQAELKSARAQRDDGEIRRLNGALADAQAKLAGSQEELAHAQVTADETFAQARKGFESALAQAKDQWAAEEAARLTEARAQWKTHTDKLFKQATIRLEGAEAALAEARETANTAQDRREGAELKRLRTEFAETRESLAEREVELAEAKVAVGRERERNRADIDAALAKAEESWKASEVVRIAEVETCERERGARALAEAMGRLERTESALKETQVQLDSAKDRGVVALAETRTRLEKTESALREARERIESMRDPANESELARLRADIASLQVTINERDAEIADQRASARRSRDEWNTRIQAAVMRARDEWRADEDGRMDVARRQWESDARLKGTMEFGPELSDGQDEEKKERRLAFDIALAAVLAGLVILGIFFYPQISGYLTGTQGAPAIGMTKAAAAIGPAVTAPALPHAVVAVSAVKMRAAPAADAHVIATILRGLDVTLMGQSGNWMHIRITGEAGNPPRDGWVHATSLKQTPPAKN